MNEIHVVLIFAMIGSIRNSSIVRICWKHSMNSSLPYHLPQLQGKLFRRSLHLSGHADIPQNDGGRKQKLRVRSMDTIDSKPPSDPTSFATSECDLATKRLLEWLEGKQSILCITGAGLSTESGIPDYRGHKGSYFNGHKPMIHDQFVSSAKHRKRYWGRAMVGWRDFALSKPNEGHIALADLEKLGIIGVEFEEIDSCFHDRSNVNSVGGGRMSIITQNVDGLHLKAGSINVTELHGRNDRLICMNCGHFSCRHHFHDLLDDLNPDFIDSISAEGSNLLPDGDGSSRHENFDNLLIPSCPRCSSGFFKPDVVFFGDNVPRSRVDRCYAAVSAADGILCIGTSLAVYSAFRFVQAAHKNNTPIAVLNVGETRAERCGIPITKIEAPIGATLSSVVRTLKGQ